MVIFPEEFQEIKFSRCDIFALSRCFRDTWHSSEARTSFISREPRNDDERKCAKSALWAMA